MKALFFAATISTLVVVPAFAGQCVALDYQEMKDMSADDLSREACKAREALGANLDDIVANLGHEPGRLPVPGAQDAFDGCKSQIERMERILTSKGVSKELLSTRCRANTDDKKQSIVRSNQVGK